MPELDLRPPCPDCGAPLDVSYVAVWGDDVDCVSSCTNVRCGARW